MENIFDRRISYYRDERDTNGAVITLRQFLFSKRHVAEIERLRKEKNEDERRRLKGLLPRATISGLFSYRDTQHLIEHSGLICIDIDGKENPTMDVEHTKMLLSEYKEIAYAGLSVGGKGLFCIIPIAHPVHHEAHFRALQKDFAGMGIVIDHNCKDICRCRNISFDPDPYINLQPETYIYTCPQPQPRQIHYEHDNSDVTIRKVYDYCREIEQMNLDITTGYEDWFIVGASLASIGEDGREAFHIVSKQNPKYKQEEADKKFTNLLRTISNYSIGTFFHLCQSYGIGT